MSKNKKKLGKSLGYDLAKMDARVIQPVEYEEIPGLTNEDIARGVVKRAGRAICTNPRVQVKVPVPELILRLRKASGPAGKPAWPTC